MKNMGSCQSSNNLEENKGHELLKPSFSHSVAQWIDGIDLETKQPKPFGPELENFYTESELKSIMDGKTDEERRKIIRNNHEALLRNNEKIDQFNNRVIEISELGKADLKALYCDKNISDSDRSIISCVGIIYSSYENGTRSNDDNDLIENLREVTQDFYGFNIIYARQTLEANGSHFKILTKKEREKLLPGSIEDIASAALESFVMNPNYSNQRIVDYDDYLYGILLDCTKRKVKKKNGVDTIEEEVDSEEFQDRVIESMSWALIDNESKNKVYSKEELDRLLKQSTDMYANYRSGHHFRNDAEEYDTRVMVDGQDTAQSIYAFNYPDKIDFFWDRYKKKIRSNNDEVFRYSRKLADVEMKQWAEKIDLDEVERINNDSSLNYEQKLSSVTLYIQEALGVQNLDKNGQSRPIEIKWFRLRESKLKKAIRKLFNMPIENEELPEKYTSAFYKHSERSIYLEKLSKPNKKLSDWMIGTLAHEMWHAKEHELEDVEKGNSILVNGDRKARMYYKNNLAYLDSDQTVAIKGDIGHLTQIVESEAYALDAHILKALKKRHMVERGRKIIEYIFGI